jgi:hypothetical protein
MPIQPVIPEAEALAEAIGDLVESSLQFPDGHRKSVGLRDDG